jgi:hypothetical protein
VTVSISRTRDGVRGHRSPTRLLLLGALLGLAWACGLRGFMAEVAGDDSGVDWGMTFGYILLPGVVTGPLLGWAEHLRASCGRRGWRWLTLAPLTFTAVLFSEGPLGFLGIFEDGIGGGAIGVPLYGIVGGYALSGRGPLWGRVVCGLLACTVVPIWALTVTSFAPHLAIDTPRGAWVALHYYSLILILMLACSIPHRAPAPSHHRDVAAPTPKERSCTGA